MKYVLVLSLLLSSFGSIANDVQDASAWLNRLSETLNQRHFSTAFVVVKNNQAEPYHWAHGIDEQGEQLEILSLLNGPRKDILRKGEIVSYIEPGLPAYSLATNQISGPIPSIFSSDINQLSQYYDFVSVGRSRILGRAAQLIRIVSKDPHRLGHWVWLDEESGMLLKMALLTSKGQLLEQVQFTYLELPENMPNQLNQVNEMTLPNVIELPSANSDLELNWQVGWLPMGFERKRVNRHRINLLKQPAEFMLFSDGLVDVSVYVTQSSDKQRAPEFVRDGATIVYNQVNNGFEVSVVGKIPTATAKLMAESIQFKLQSIQ